MNLNHDRAGPQIGKMVSPAAVGRVGKKNQRGQQLQEIFSHNREIKGVRLPQFFCEHGLAKMIAFCWGVGESLEGTK